MRVVFVLLICWSFTAKSQSTFDPPSAPDEVVAVAARGEMRVDGVLDEESWKAAQPVGAFVQYEPLQGQEPTFRTEVRIVFDRAYLYIGAFCYDASGKDGVVVQNLQRDFDFTNNDLFGIAIDGFIDKRNAMVFQTNPFGAQRELLSTDGDNFNREWDGLWKVKTLQTDSGWYAEMAIPWKTLRYPAEAKSLGFVLTRNIRRLNENLTYPAMPRNFAPYRMSYEAVLSSIDPPPPSANVIFNPYLLTKVEQTPEGATEWKADLGGEVKWAATPNTVVDLTANTDFAQADVDRQVVNLERFSVQFPERRQFFLEGATIYQTQAWDPLQPFFSRRIGLDDEGNPVPIQAGTRLTKRTSKQDVGLMAIRQGRSGNVNATNFGVARYSRNFAAQSRVGSMVTVRADELADRTSTNGTATLDGFFRPTQRTGAYWMLSGSKTFGHEMDDGLAGGLWAYYSDNLLYVGHVQAVITENYNPKMGFINASNYIVTSPAFSLKLRPKWLPSFVRQYTPGVTFYFYHFQNSLQYRQGYISYRPLSLTFQNGSELSYSYRQEDQILLDVFNPVGIQVAGGTYRYATHRVGVNSDYSRRMAFSTTLLTGGYYDGRINSLQASLRWVPNPRATFRLDMEQNRILSLGVDGTNITTTLFGVEGRLALNPRVQLITFYQYNSSASRSVINTRFVWEYRPLSFIYFVYNSDTRETVNSMMEIEKIQTQNGILKVTLLKQF